MHEQDRATVGALLAIRELARAFMRIPRLRLIADAKWMGTSARSASHTRGGICQWPAAAAPQQRLELPAESLRRRA